LSRMEKSIREEIEFLQRKVIINSILYYVMDESIMRDSEYDKVAKKLEKLQKKNGCEGTQYEYCMKDFSSATGFDIWGKLNEGDREYLGHLASVCLWLSKGEKKKK